VPFGQHTVPVESLVLAQHRPFWVTTSEIYSRQPLIGKLSNFSR